jgi:hypothetical protein
LLTSDDCARNPATATSPATATTGKPAAAATPGTKTKKTGQKKAGSDASCGQGTCST